MSTTGAVFPQSAESVSEAPHSDDTWDDPTFIVADDTDYASVTSNTYDSGDQTYVLKAYNFDFSAIPDNATIQGVTCVVSAFTSGAAVQSLDLCQLLNVSRAKVGDNKASTPIQLSAVAGAVMDPLGGSADTWSNALTPAWVKNSNFGVALGCISGTNNSDVFCDYVTLEITYTAPVTEVLAGEVAGQSSATSVLSVLRTIAGEIDAVSSAVGTLTSSGGVVYETLAGVVAATSSSGGVLRRNRRMASSVASSTTAGGIIRRIRQLAVSVASATTSAAQMMVSVGLGANVASTSTVTLGLRRIISLAASITVNSSMQAQLNGAEAFIPGSAELGISLSL